jgi:SAM-dependent methyltransferase
MKKVLDIGCGNKKYSGSIGIDFNPQLDADVVHDLNVFPYPFEDAQFDEVHMRDNLFLLNEPVKVMEEVYRLSKIGAHIVIRQPYFRSVWNYVDPMINNFGTVHSFAFYDPDDAICTRYEYSKARYKTIKIIFNNKIPSRMLKRLIIVVANRFPRKYELYLSHLFPLDTITFHLKKLDNR